MSAEDALLKHHAKQLRKTGVSRKNNKPEQEVVKLCMLWFRENGFSMHAVEAKAVYNASAGRYINGQTVAGMTDLVGCTPNGYACFVEVKARGKLSTLRLSQEMFMKDKIIKGSFSVAVDCVERLEGLYFKWKNFRKDDPEKAIAFLLDQIPKKRKKPTDAFL